MYRFVIALLLVCGFALASSAQEKVPFPVLPEKEAWGKLPPQKKPALPKWARVLAGPMPKTTAKMLELDYLHRAKNPLGPVLSGKIRWLAAEAVGCEYGRAAAEIDLRRAGLTAADIDGKGPLAPAFGFAAATVSMLRCAAEAGGGCSACQWAYQDAENGQN